MIGDVLTSSIMFEAIKSKYPNYELHYLINTHTIPVVENNPFIDEFVLFTPKAEKEKAELFRLIRKIRSSKYDVIIDVYSKLSSNLIVLGSKAKMKISYRKSSTKFLYTHTFKNIQVSEQSSGLALADRLQLLAPLGIESTKPYRPKIYLTEGERTEALELLKAHQIDLEKKVFMISVLGSGPSKTYPFEYMAEVLNQIHEINPESQILFNYIPNQREDALKIYEQCQPEVQKNINLALFGKSLRSFLALTSYCDALIGNEGGAVNMAKALNIRTFTIFSPWIRKESWNLFEDDIKHISVHLKDYRPIIYNHIEHPKELKSQAISLYKEFKPKLFSAELTSFLKKLD